MLRKPLVLDVLLRLRIARVEETRGRECVYMIQDIDVLGLIATRRVFSRGHESHRGNGGAHKQETFWENACIT